MYEQMDWIEKESFLNLNMCNSSEKSDSGLNETNNTVSIPVSKCDDINSQSDIKDGKNVLLNKEIDDSDVMPFLKCDDQLDSVSSDSDDGEGDSMLNERKAVFLPRLKCKNERRRVLKITMAKIRDVDDPEAYLRRSVLIFNTVRILKGNNGDTRNADANEKYESMDVMYQNDNDSKHEIPSNIVECQYASSASNDGNFYNDPQLQGCENVSYPPNFNLSDDITSDKTVQTLPHNNGTSLCSLNDGSLNQAALPSSIVKQPSTLHPFSSQPSGLQYKNSNHSDDSKDDCQDSLPSGSSILDSVVYQSLKTYLET
ncbi:hypothetical protein CEXT_610851 [Caerostris extrusa]|uniref:SERTA domain-containing protein n=1 Tax=Caerostris extrusa TaxID=172846 RepID=A0AAV4QKQ4_CAEEX|nr:hypothetical protein CEXT_610851 [Caerostris extrusa]